MTTQTQEELRQNLTDVGCDEGMSEAICRLYETRQLQDAIRRLRCYRCGLMEELHRSQQKVDCLDFLIYRMKQEQNEQGNKQQRKEGTQ